MYSLVHVYNLNQHNQLEEKWIVKPFVAACGCRFRMDVDIMYIYSFINGFMCLTNYNGFLIN